MTIRVRFTNFLCRQYRGHDVVLTKETFGWTCDIDGTPHGGAKTAMGALKGWFEIWGT